MTSSPSRGLLDECVPRRLLRLHLADLNLSHVLDEGWAGRRNGALLRLMMDAGFTTHSPWRCYGDMLRKNLPFQSGVNRKGQTCSGLTCVPLPDVETQNNPNLKGG